MNFELYYMRECPIMPAFASIFVLYFNNGDEIGDSFFFTIWILLLLLLLLWLRLLASFSRCHGLLGNRAIIISFLGPLFSLGLSIDLKLMVEEAGLNDLLWIPIHGLNLLLVTFAKGLCFHFLFFFLIVV